MILHCPATMAWLSHALPADDLPDTRSEIPTQSCRSFGEDEKIGALTAEAEDQSLHDLRQRRNQTQPNKNKFHDSRLMRLIVRCSGCLKQDLDDVFSSHRS